MEEVKNLICCSIIFINKVGSTVGTFYNYEKTNFSVENCYFITNIGDFGCALNFEHKGGYTYVIDSLFDGNKNPTHPMGSGSIIKLTGDITAKVIIIRILAKNTNSFGTGLYGLYKANLTDINSTYISIYS